jgi:hypothetical protein
MSQRLPQPARGVRVQRRPERRVERLLEPPVTCGTGAAQLAEPLQPSSICQNAVRACRLSAAERPVSSPRASVQTARRLEPRTPAGPAQAGQRLNMVCVHCIVERSAGQWRPTQFLGRYLCRELVQAYSPWPSGHTGAGHVRTHAALGRMPLKGLQAAVSTCNKAASARHDDSSKARAPWTKSMQGRINVSVSKYTTSLRCSLMC